MAALTPKQQKAKTERAFKRRQERRMAEKADDAVDVDSGERYEVQVYDNDSSQTRRKAEAASEHLKTLRMPDPDKVEEKAVLKRQRYAPMKRNMEIAAYVIAAGGSVKLAARKTGLSTRQIRKYQSMGDFRDRVVELHELLATRVRGKVIKEVDRRTSPKMIKKMELLDLLRVGDRFGLGRGAGSVIVNDNREINHYEATFNALFHKSGSTEDSERLLDAEEEGADFPEFEPTSLALSGGDSPVDG